MKALLIIVGVGLLFGIVTIPVGIGLILIGLCLGD